MVFNLFEVLDSKFWIRNVFFRYWVQNTSQITMIGIIFNHFLTKASAVTMYSPLYSRRWAITMSGVMCISFVQYRGSFWVPFGEVHVASVACE